MAKAAETLGFQVGSSRLFLIVPDTGDRKRTAAAGEKTAERSWTVERLPGRALGGLLGTRVGTLTTSRREPRVRRRPIRAANGPTRLWWLQVRPYRKRRRWLSGTPQAAFDHKSSVEAADGGWLCRSSGCSLCRLPL